MSICYTRRGQFSFGKVCFTRELQAAQFFYARELRDDGGNVISAAVTSPTVSYAASSPLEIPVASRTRRGRIRFVPPMATKGFGRALAIQSGIFSLWSLYAADLERGYRFLGGNLLLRIALSLRSLARRRASQGFS